MILKDQYCFTIKHNSSAEPWRACPESGAAGVWSLRKTPLEIGSLHKTPY